MSMDYGFHLTIYYAVQCLNQNELSLIFQTCVQLHTLSICRMAHVVTTTSQQAGALCVVMQLEDSHTKCFTEERDNHIYA